MITLTWKLQWCTFNDYDFENSQWKQIKWTSYKATVTHSDWSVIKWKITEETYNLLKDYEQWTDVTIELNIKEGRANQPYIQTHDITPN